MPPVAQIVLAMLIGVAVAADRPARADEPSGGRSVRSVGVATVDITPDYPIRLSGYANRTSEAAGAAQPIFAKALAIGGDADGPAVLVAVDNCSVPASVTEAVSSRLRARFSIPREKLVVCSTHTHTAPKLKGVVPMLFGGPLPPPEQQHIDRYTQELIDRLEQAAAAALADRRPSRLDWAVGRATFAANRRTRDGPADQSLPVLRVVDEGGGLRAVLMVYACHCTTLEGGFNRIHGDWAGCAREQIERDHPGVTALIVIGCGGDANPQPRGELGHARAHGRAIGEEVTRLLMGEFHSIEGPLQARLEKLQLRLDPPPDRDVWARRTESQDAAVAYHARVNLQRLDRGEALPGEVAYPVQCWSFGDSLAMVFLAGEVVVDYALRLRRELDERRLWITAYANDVPCYIPSERVLAEGGYEAGDAMVFFDLPSRLQAGVEEQIAGAVKKLVPRAFHSRAAVSAPAKSR